jgi:sialate O-acetylesterase
MLKGWRKDFDQGNLPFYFVQMPPYNFAKHDSTANQLALFREVQTVMLKVKNTGMAVTMDSKEFDNLHPRNKKPVGIRLAKVALRQTYDHRDIVDEGPVYKKFKVEGNTAKISFDKTSIGGGLTTNDGQPPKYFYVAGTDRIFHEARAQINGNEVWISSPEVQHPVAVRYAFTNYPVTNFENKEGLPAWPFRTDKWEQ